MDRYNNGMIRIGDVAMALENKYDPQTRKER